MPAPTPSPSPTPFLFTVLGRPTPSLNRASWQDTGLDIPNGASVTLTASGLIAHGGGSIGPAGVNSTWGDTLVPSLRALALIGKIGRNGTPFLVGSRLVLSGSGQRLFLAINDSWVNDNSGSWSIQIQ
ncbi:MAG: hypothetical protein VKP57_00100 [Candidatus Sericytochromatia bacterium]|nr:hypothetical protein [Candidatus Sericytochromatia bacterium]